MKLIPKSLDISHIGDIITHESTTSEVRITDGFLLAGTVMLASLNSAILHGLHFPKREKFSALIFCVRAYGHSYLFFSADGFRFLCRLCFSECFMRRCRLFFSYLSRKRCLWGPYPSLHFTAICLLLLSTVCGVVFWHENCGVFQIFRNCASCCGDGDMHLQKRYSHLRQRLGLLCRRVLRLLPQE